MNDTAEDIARIYLDGVVREHGLSKHIISDRDTKFTSKFWRTFVELLGIKLKMSTSFHPETDGQTERSNRILQDCLRHYVNYAQDNWDDLLGPIEYVINSAKQSSTGYSPFELDYGRRILYPTDLIVDHINHKNKPKYGDHSSKQMVDNHRMLIRELIEKFNESNTSLIDKVKKFNSNEKKKRNDVTLNKSKAKKEIVLKAREDDKKNNEQPSTRKSKRERKKKRFDEYEINSNVLIRATNLGEGCNEITII